MAGSVLIYFTVSCFNVVQYKLTNKLLSTCPGSKKKNQAKSLLGIHIICCVLSVGVLQLAMHLGKRLYFPQAEGGTRRGKDQTLMMGLGPMEIPGAGFLPEPWAMAFIFVNLDMQNDVI